MKACIFNLGGSVLPPVAEVRVVVDEPTAELVDKDDGESCIGDVVEVIEDGQEEDEEESDAGGDLDVVDKGEDSDENDRC